MTCGVEVVDSWEVGMNVVVVVVAVGDEAVEDDELVREVRSLFMPRLEPAQSQ